MQKETDHLYTVVTRVDINATGVGSKAGIYLTNGNQTVSVRLYSGYEQGKKIIFKLDTATRIARNPFGNIVWLKLVRNEHRLYGYFSGDGKSWVSLGTSISSVVLDKVQSNFNSWVGTSVGLFAEGKPADFDLFICKDGSSALPAAGYSNYYGVKIVGQNEEKAVTNTSVYGGWLMISGVDLGRQPRSIELIASSKTGGKVEVWLDDLQQGKLIATIPVSATGSSNWKVFSKFLKDVTGQHDVFVKFPSGFAQDINIKSIRFPSK